jgi:hypothetical protein
MQRDSWRVRQLSVSGLLARTDVHRTGVGDVALGVVQHFEFQAEPMVLGDQSIAAALLYRRGMGGRAELRADVQVQGVVLAEIESTADAVRRRDYDYAPGLGVGIHTGFHYGGRELVAVGARALWLRSLYPAPVRHTALTGQVRTQVPIALGFALGGGAGFTLRRSVYQSGVGRRTIPEIRAFITRASR